MWFAALSTPRYNPWFFRFELRLLQNSPPVLALLRHNPFPNAPPKYVRAMLYEYHFTDLAERRATGGNWVAAKASRPLHAGAFAGGIPPRANFRR